MSEETITCPLCGQECPILELNCPNDNWQLPGTPNLRVASTVREVDALQARYDAALAIAKTNGTDKSLLDFESRVASDSHAVISVGYTELRGLIENVRKVFPSFYQLVDAGLVIPSGGKWDVLRGVAEHALYRHQKANVRFAALSLDHVGVKNYGPCHATLRENLIANRTSTFEDNNVVFTIYTERLEMAEAVELPAGHMSDWSSKHKLAVAKHTPELSASSLAPGESAAILIKQGATTADDRFIELHIWGPMTILTIEEVVFTPRRQGRRKHPTRAEISSLKDHLKNYGIGVVEK